MKQFFIRSAVVLISAILTLTSGIISCGVRDFSDTEKCREHSFGEWQEDVQPSCNAEGKRHRECEVCHEIEEETLPTVSCYMSLWCIAKPQNCTEDGYRYRECYYCRRRDTETLYAYGHSWSEADKEGGIRKCSECGADEVYVPSDE